jgi:hypothetical protein
VRSAIEIVEAEFKPVYRVGPKTTKRMVLADEEQAIRFQDTRRFSVVALEIRNPDRNMSARVDDIERHRGQGG